MRKAIIIEDEKRAQIYLKGIIEMHIPNFDICAVCDDLPSGVIAIRKHKPDLVFLDIEMPKYNGLEIVNFFDAKEIDFSIIFTTAYSEYAIQAFKTSAIDYLLKPIDPDELKASVERFETNQKNSAVALEKIKSKLWNTKIAIPDGNNLILIDTSEITYFKAEGSYTAVFLLNGKKHITSRFLKNFEDSLKEIPAFFRCHKSYLVNLNFATSFSKSNGGTLMMLSNIEVPVSVDKTEELMHYFTKIDRI
jgi:two-component system LytT family response regulator